MKLTLILGGFVASSLIAPAALAQQAVPAVPAVQGQLGHPGEMFERDRNVSVIQRPRPEFETSGVRAGAFIFRPELHLALEYTDNVFATASSEQEDFVANINPKITLDSTWSRHSFSADASLLRREYFDFDDESVWNFNAGAVGRVDVVRDTFFQLSGNYAELTEPRTSAGAAGQAEEPIEYDTGTLNAAFERAVNRIKFLAAIDYSAFDYKDAPLFGGGVADQDFRDRNELTYTLRGDYAVSPDTALFARARFNEREYDLSPPAVALLRDSSGYVLDAGADFDLGGLARGEVALGYLEQDFDDPVQPDIDGLSVTGLLEWFPTQLTTVTFNAGRSANDSAVSGAAGFLGTNFGVQVDHELRRNVILTGRIALSEDDYEGIDRTDERFDVTASVTYLLNRHVGMKASVNHFEQDSEGAAGNQDYELNRFIVSLTYAL